MKSSRAVHKVEFDLSEDNRLISDLIDQKSDLIARLNQMLHQVSLYGIESVQEILFAPVNRLELKALKKKLLNIQSTLISQKNNIEDRFNRYTAYVQKQIDIDPANEITSEQEFLLPFAGERKNKFIKSIGYENQQINDASKEIDFILNCYSNNTVWQQSIIAKQQDLLSKSVAISNLSELGSGTDRMLSDYVIIHYPTILNKLNFNIDALITFIDKYPLCHLANRLKEIVINEIDMIRQQNQPNKLNRIKEISRQMKKAERFINISPKRIYLISEIENYIQKRSADKREHITTFLYIGIGVSRSTKLGAAQALLEMAKNREIIYEDWEKLDPQYKAALQQGELSKVFNEFNELLKNEIQSVDYYVQYNARYDGFK